MPVVLRVHGLRFVIFVDDHLPPHVHVRGRGEVRILLDAEATLATNKGMNKADVARARDAVRANRKLLSDTWASIHG